MAWKEKLAEIYVEITSKTGPLKSALAKAKAMVKRGMATLTRLAKRGAMAIGVALAGAFIWAAKAAMKQEDATARLGTTLKATGHAAGWTKKQILKLAADLQKVTRFGDETIIAMQTMLLTFKQITGDEFRRASEAALDMATAEAAVSGRTVDLTAASIRLGKALNDPILGVTALRRVGVQLTRQQEEQIKNFVEGGQVARAQRVILGELESQFGGMARTVDTTRGKLTQLWNVISDVAEKALAPLLERLKPVIQGWKDWVLEHEKLIAQKIDEYFTAIGDALKWVAKWSKTTGVGLRTVLKAIVGLVGLVVLAKIITSLKAVGGAIKGIALAAKGVVVWIGPWIKRVVFATTAATIRLKGVGHEIVKNAIKVRLAGKVFVTTSKALVASIAGWILAATGISLIVNQIYKWIAAVVKLTLAWGRFWLSQKAAAKVYREQRARLRKEAREAAEEAHKKLMEEEKARAGFWNKRREQIREWQRLWKSASDRRREAAKEERLAAEKIAKEQLDAIKERLRTEHDAYADMEGYEKQAHRTSLALMKVRAKEIAKELGITEKAALAGLAARRAAELAAAAPIEEAVERAKVGFARFGDAWTQIASQLTGREKIDTMQLREQQLSNKYLRSISEDIKDIELEEGGFI